MEAIHKERLLNVAKALREEAARRKANPPRNSGDRFNMECFANQCGSPGCALGTYAHRADLQSAFRIAKLAGGTWWVVDAEGEQVYVDGPERDPDTDELHGESYASRSIKEHFGLTDEQAAELFWMTGCGNAQTEHEAADYIEAFVARDGEPDNA